MSNLNDSEIKKIASLAHIEIAENELSAYAEELSGILHFVEKINTVETKHIEPMAHPLGVVQRLRKDKDISAIADQVETLHKNAPAMEKQVYLVPKIIDYDS